MTDGGEAANARQIAYWAAQAGPIWAEHQRALDAMLAGATDLLLARAAPGAGERAIDLGCGAGASTERLADAVGPEGAVLGVDVSPPLLALARERLAGRAQVRLLEADAQTHGFAPEAADLALSRFGVMFFEDPRAAFANIARALAPETGRAAFLAWAGVEENPWFAAPRAVAEARLGPVDPPPPRAPGPMAFAETGYVLEMFEAAGFEAEAETADVTLTPPGGVAGAGRLAAHLGPAARIIQAQNGTEADLAAIAAGVSEALAPYATASGAVEAPARVIVYTARRRGAG